MLFQKLIPLILSWKMKMWHLWILVACRRDRHSWTSFRPMPCRRKSWRTARWWIYPLLPSWPHKTAPRIVPSLSFAIKLVFGFRSRWNWMLFLESASLRPMPSVSFQRVMTSSYISIVKGEIEKSISLQFTPLESPAVRSGDDGCSFFREHGV